MRHYEDVPRLAEARLMPDHIYCARLNCISTRAQFLLEAQVSDETPNGYNIVVGLLCFGAFVLLFWMLSGAMKASADPIIKLPLLVITGVMALFATLAVVAVTFSVAGLSDPTQALGLPEGSVRAAIALSLVVIFAIVSIYFYTSAVAKDSPVAAGSPGSDLAKQILTLVGTLMASVTSFYFAARSAAPTSATPKPSEPALVDVTPASAAVGAQPVSVPLEISGTDLQLAKTVKLKSGDTTVLATNVVSGDQVIKCVLTMPPGLAAGDYDVVVTNSDDATASLPKAFKVQAGG